MRHKSGRLRDNIRKFIDDFFAENGRAPSSWEVADGTGTSKSTAYRYLLFLDETGMIKYDGRNITTPLIEKYDGRKSMAAVYGAADDDAAEAAQDEIIPDAYVTVPEAIFGSGEIFLMKADRDEPECGIYAGDYVAAERRDSAKAGEIAVVEQDGKLRVVKVPGNSEQMKVKGVVCRVVKKVNGII